MSQATALTTDEQKLNDVWIEHLRTEFNPHSADEAIATMEANPLVNQVPVMIGGDGKEGVHEFYAEYFLPQIPPDMEMVHSGVVDHPAREAGRRNGLPVYPHNPNRLDAARHRAEGKRVETAMLVVAQFDGDKLAHEHLYWDQASVLVQLGLLNRTVCRS